MRSPVQLPVCRPPRSAKATRPGKARLEGLRASSAPVARSISVTTCGAGGARADAQHPLDVGVTDSRRGRSERLRERQARDLDRVGERHVLQEVGGDAVRLVLEAAVAEAVAGDVAAAVADRLGGRRPELAGRLVADVDRLAGAGRSRDRSTRRSAGSRGCSRPRCSRCPRPRPGSRSPVGDDVDPGRGRRRAAVEDGHVLGPVLVEAAEAVEELERRRAAAAAPGIAAERRGRGARDARAAAAAGELVGDAARAGRRSTTRATAASSVALLRASSGRRAARGPRPAPARGRSAGRDWLVRTAVSIASAGPGRRTTGAR